MKNLFKDKYGYHNWFIFSIMIFFAIVSGVILFKCAIDASEKNCESACGALDAEKIDYNYSFGCICGHDGQRFILER